MVDTTGGKVGSVGENESIIASIWVACEGGLDIFAVYFGHSEG